MENNYQPIPENLTNMIIVPGHAIYVGTSSEDLYDKGKWVGIYDKYKDNDEVPNYVEHVTRGIKHAVLDDKALLVFSGGKTRTGTDQTEAQSYCKIAEQLSLLQSKKLSKRVRLEEYATDSFENLIFSILLFRKLHPQKLFPKKVTVVGLAFKEERYLFHYHTLLLQNALYTINRPINGPEVEQFARIGYFDFVYDGVNDIPAYLTESKDGERKTLSDFMNCPLGDSGTLLQKRLKRDPYSWYSGKPYGFCHVPDTTCADTKQTDTLS